MAEQEQKISSAHEDEVANTKALAVGFRDQSYLWRALALLQMPVTVISIVTAIVFYASADTILNVSPRPAPGYYLTEQIPDSEFVKVAMEFVNLISSYQPAVAERQFTTALNYLWEPEYTAFRNHYLAATDGTTTELEEIRQTQRSRMFFTNRDLITIRRQKTDDPKNDTVKVRVPGELHAFIGGKPQQIDLVVHNVVMQTTPKNLFNPNGIVVVNYEVTNKVPESFSGNLYQDLMTIDHREELEAKRKRQPVPFTKYKW